MNRRLRLSCLRGRVFRPKDEKPPNFPSELRKGAKLKKALANHLTRDRIRLLVPSRKIDVIPVEITYTAETIEALALIEPKSSALLVLAPGAFNNSRFVIAQLRKFMKHSDVEITPISMFDLKSFRAVLKGSEYDRIIVDPGARREIPHELRQSPRILLLRVQLDLGSLESARIRCGVII